MSDYGKSDLSKVRRAIKIMMKETNRATLGEEKKLKRKATCDLLELEAWLLTELRIDPKVSDSDGVGRGWDVLLEVEERFGAE